ncbi:MAG: AAA family ATPase, partial [Flavobacteriales bacterium]|nr:AAA family ATPase [Flavobacteriales bacterium]
MLQELELLIIDEVSMLRADLLDAIDTMLRSVKRNRFTPFGGVQLLLIGDLLQLPPVVKDNEWYILKSYYKSIYFFDALALKDNPPLQIELNKIYRQADERFINLLNNLRNNTV